MAGDWLPIRLDLHDDPAVIAIAAAVGLDEYAVVGRLLKLWGWANRNTSDGNARGNARGVTGSWVDRYLSASGFAQAMLDAGWLLDVTDGAPGVLCFPKFDRWNSQGAKKRVLTARRVASHRTGGNAECNAPRNAKSNAPSVTDALAKEEKRREEKSNTPQPPADGGHVTTQPGTALAPAAPPRPKADTAESVPIPAELDTAEFRGEWADWLAARKGKRKPVSERGARGQLADLATIGAAGAVACIRESIRNDWQGLFPEKFRAGSAPRPNLFDRGAAQESRMAAQIAEALAGCVTKPEGDR